MDWALFSACNCSIADIIAPFCIIIHLSPFFSGLILDGVFGKSKPKDIVKPTKD